MKKSLFGALLLFVLAACSPRMETVVILSTNDIHAHIEKFPQLAEAVKKCRDTVKNVILVDAGDRWTGNVYCDRAAEPRRPIIDLMNRLRYDVATFGNHEFDAGQAFLGVRTAQCRFPVVCANIVSDTATFPQPAPYAIVERGGRRIGFVASVTNYDHNNHPAGHDENFAGLTFTDAVDAVADRQSLRDECDALVALTHIGTKKDRVLAEKAPRYDVIVGGHSHDETNETVGGVLVTQTGKNLDNVGVTVLRFRGDELVEKSFRLVPLAGYEPAPAYQRMVEGYYSDPALRAKVADLRGRLDKTGLANVFTEAVREAGKADVGIYHIGGVRLDSIPAGGVSAAKVYGLEPFGTLVARMEMTPAQMRRMIVSKYNDPVNAKEAHRIDLISTTPYVIVTDAADNALDVQFPKLREGRKYKVAVSDYIYRNYKDMEYTGGEITVEKVADILLEELRDDSPLKIDNTPRQRVVRK